MDACILAVAEPGATRAVWYVSRVMGDCGMRASSPAAARIRRLPGDPVRLLKRAYSPFACMNIPNRCERSDLSSYCIPIDWSVWRRSKKASIASSLDWNDLLVDMMLPGRCRYM